MQIKSYDYIKRKHIIAISFLFCLFILLSFLVYSNNKLIEEVDKLSYSFLYISNYVKFTDFDIITNTVLLSLSYGEDIFWSFIMFFLFFFAGREGRYIVFILLVSYLLLVPIGFLSKDIIKRDRPFLVSDTIMQNVSSFTHRERTYYSYPSGHAIIVSTGAFVMVFHLLYLDNNNNNNSHCFNYNRKKHFIISFVSAFLVIEAGWICILQISIGVHYLTDVLAGIILSMGISLFVILCFGKQIRKMQDLLSSIPVFSLFEKHMEKIVKSIIKVKLS